MTRFDTKVVLCLSLVAAFVAAAGCSNETGRESSNGSGSSAGNGGNGAVAGNGGNDGGNAGGNNGGGGGGGGGGGWSAPIFPTCADGIVMAIDKIFFGDTDWDGTPNLINGWKQYGRNIDKLVSTKSSVDLCQPNAGSTPVVVYPDGLDGIDNSFGRNVLLIFLGLATDLPAATNEAIQKGHYTYLLTIRGPNESKTCPASALFGALSLGNLPKWDGTDQWPLNPAFFADPQDPTSVKNVFLGAAVTNSIYQSGPEAQFDLELRVNGYTMHLPIQHAQFEMTLDAGQTSVNFGHISGIIDPDALASEIKARAGALHPSFCNPSSDTLKSIANQVRQAADILIDGTQDPTKVCNGISIGLGFTMKSAKLGAIGPAAPTPSDPCKP